ncbi:hypothetical protein Scep_024286 [Stephania cephalantha]|uniref:Myb/SANT-like DNA-binding domain-containing protein n=1 Tax=Stephania cephalantha TaxID=152367 RepID=A0AAP0EXF6_9MAGN
MEDEEERQSYSNNENGHQPLAAEPVTVAAAPPQQTLTLALPIQQPRPSGAGGGREDCWSVGATSVLIEAWGERYLELSRGNLKQQHWKEVADIVNSSEDYSKTPKTDIQCKNRIDTLKKKYKVEKSKTMLGQGPSKWNFFNRLDQLIGPNSKISATATAATANASSVPSGPKVQIRAQVPVAIPVGVRTFHKPQQQQVKKEKFETAGSTETNSSASEPESSDSFPPEIVREPKRPRIDRALNLGETRKRKMGTTRRKWDNSMRDLSSAILELVEAYERAETSKLRQVVEMEKQRMGFAKELELQRMQFCMKTLSELSQLKPGRRPGNNSRHHFHHLNNNRNNSD